MKKISLSDARMKFSSLVRTVGKTDTQILIAKRGQPAAVLMSFDEFESWKETMYIKSSQSLMVDIGRGLKKVRKAKAYTLNELLDAIG